MTREEEIKLAASCHIAASNEDFKEYYEGFIAGAKWADKTMIEKACEWLENNASNYIIEHPFSSDVDFEEDKMVEDFKNYMKGE